MLPGRCRTIVFAAPLLILMAAEGCAPGSPEARIAKVRSQYEVELTGWLPRQPEGADQAPPADVIDDQVTAVAGEAASASLAATATESAAVGEEAAGEEGMVDEEPGPVRTTILFDLLVTFKGSKPLDGITLDITHADAAEQTKEVRRHYIETAGMLRGSSEQISVLLDDFLLEEGDAFAVELRSPIPPEEIGDYRELSASGS